MIQILQKIRMYLIQISLIFVVILAFGLQFRSCNIKKDLMQAQLENRELLVYGQKMSEKVGEQGQKIAFQEAKYFDEKSKNETLLQRITKLESTISEFHSETITIIDSVFVPYEKIDTTLIGSEIIINYHFTRSDSNLFLKGFANSERLFIDTLMIPNKMRLTHKWERKNYFAKKRYIVEVENSNPYVQVVGLQNYTFVEDKKWHEKRGVNFALGLVFGFLVSKDK